MDGQLVEPEVQSIDILWVHPIGLETHEINNRLKSETDSTFFAKEPEMPSLAENLPSISEGQQCYLFVADLSFDFETRETVKSASLVSILKTLQSLFCLGKQITFLKLGEWNAPFDLGSQVISYNWAKAYRVIKEHRILSLAAFEPQLSSFCSHKSFPDPLLSLPISKPKPRQSVKMARPTEPLSAGLPMERLSKPQVDSIYQNLIPLVNGQNSNLCTVTQAAQINSSIRQLSKQLLQQNASIKAGIRQYCLDYKERLQNRPLPPPANIEGTFHALVLDSQLFERYPLEVNVIGQR